MGQGRWIKEREGHYKHYTEEEYQNSPHGIAEKWGAIISVIIYGLIAIGIAISIVVGILVTIWNWLVGLF